MSMSGTLIKMEIHIFTAITEKRTKSFPKRLRHLSDNVCKSKGAITMLQKNKDKQERKVKRKPVLRPCRFTKKTTYTRKKGRNRDE